MDKVINAHGRIIDLDAAYVLMDHDILEDLEFGDGRDHQEFFDAYCAAHLAKFGEEFEPNTENPVW